MNRYDRSGQSSLNDLAQQVRQGSRQAAERFVEVMRPQMERMVRQTVRRHSGPDSYGPASPQGQRILEEYRSFCQPGQGASGLSGDEIVARVAGRLCQTMLDQLRANRAAPMALETVRC